MAWVYLLHFGSMIEHAEHYSGATHKLERRLRKHANGQGSALCKELRKRGIHWRLAAVWLTDSPFADERLMKGQHNARRFCPLCRDCPARLGDAMPVDLELLEIGTTSQEFLQ